MQVIIYLPSEVVNGNMRARSAAAMRRAAAIAATRRSGQQNLFAAIVGVISGAMLLGLFGAGVGAIWSLALGFNAGIGALCAGLVVFVLDLVLLPIDARLGRALSSGMAALAVLAGAMILGAIVWGIRAL